MSNDFSIEKELERLDKSMPPQGDEYVFSRQKALDKLREHEETINEAASRNNIPKEVLQATLYREMRQQNLADVVGDRIGDNSRGLAQVKPSALREHSGAYNLLDEKQNIQAAALILGWHCNGKFDRNGRLESEGAEQKLQNMLKYPQAYMKQHNDKTVGQQGSTRMAGARELNALAALTENEKMGHVEEKTQKIQRALDTMAAKMEKIDTITKELRHCENFPNLFEQPTYWGIGSSNVTKISNLQKELNASLKELSGYANAEGKSIFGDGFTGGVAGFDAKVLERHNAEIAPMVRNMSADERQSLKGALGMTSYVSGGPLRHSLQDGLIRQSYAETFEQQNNMKLKEKDLKDSSFRVCDEPSASRSLTGGRVSLVAPFASAPHLRRLVGGEEPSSSAGASPTLAEAVSVQRRRCSDPV